MSNRHQRLAHVVRTAAIGAGSAVLLVALLFALFSPTGAPVSFFAFFLPLAAVGGALFGVLLGRVEPSPGVIGLGSVLGGLLGGLVACVVFPFGALWYKATPFPSPRPYQTGVDFVEGAVGSFGIGRSATYTVTAPVTMLQEYFNQEMSHYCVTEWQFEYVALPVSKYEANCLIRRFWLEQSFIVRLYPVSDTATKVIQSDLWED